MASYPALHETAPSVLLFQILAEDDEGAPRAGGLRCTGRRPDAIQVYEGECTAAAPYILNLEA